MTIKFEDIKVGDRYAYTPYKERTRGQAILSGRDKNEIKYIFIKSDSGTRNNVVILENSTNIDLFEIKRLVKKKKFKFKIGDKVVIDNEGTIFHKYTAFIYTAFIEKINKGKIHKYDLQVLSNGYKCRSIQKEEHLILYKEEEKPTFKFGDRVRVSNEESSDFGKEGILVQCDGSELSMRVFYNEDCVGENFGRHWWFKESELEKIEEEKYCNHKEKLELGDKVKIIHDHEEKIGVFLEYNKSGFNGINYIIAFGKKGNDRGIAYTWTWSYFKKREDGIFVQII